MNNPAKAPVDTGALARFRAPLAAEDTCPECLGELDTGWECNDCGFDAQNLIRQD